eukprot:CAMPEP_0113729868 /NCGR_PEP_ID=MMETSP0038_2-20120614/42818_1 /TAXON_ID=2898 /ORGANISM="Cryptomonas paramecium" /LENGTH=58 /DNA_ID=CAMNT_0000661817 /DNA_START=87 /DNA_END=259 /DNA_ORIENTATION=+ /assembly_acc=CAM_ASM_000170
MILTKLQASFGMARVALNAGRASFRTSAVASLKLKPEASAEGKRIKYFQIYRWNPEVS